jgi:hypothetical protein
LFRVHSPPFKPVCRRQITFGENTTVQYSAQVIRGEMSYILNFTSKPTVYIFGIGVILDIFQV